jgi:hypothetical protein
MRKELRDKGLVALLTLLGAFSPAAQPVKVAIGWHQRRPAGHLGGQDTGIFAKNNLDAQAIYFSGGTLSVTAMISAIHR